MHVDIQTYHNAQSEADRAICELLGAQINLALPEAESKVWHAHPVWFLDGNPVAGYHKLKGCVRLLFWSGQSFDESGLKGEGKFKAAEARYMDAAQIALPDLRRWLGKAARIQWNYRDIVKRRGVLEKIGERCVVLRIDEGERITRIEETACPIDLELGERLRLAGAVCLREGGSQARARPVVCPDPLTNAEKVFLEKEQAEGRLPKAAASR